MWVDAANRDLIQHVEQTDRIGRIGTGPSEGDDDWAELVVAVLLLKAGPPFSPARLRVVSS